MSEAETGATRFSARVAGPFLLVLAAMIFLRYERFPELMPQVVADAPLVLITGLVTLILGLIWIAAHHHVGSAAAIVVTILAALTALRGAVLMLAPEIIFGVAESVSQTPVIMLATTTIALLLGGWLSYVGWIAGKI